MTAGKREKSTMASPTMPEEACGHWRASHSRSDSLGSKVKALSAVQAIGAVTPILRRRSAAALLRVDAAGLLRDRALLGQLLETFVLQELRRMASWQAEPIEFHHFRDKDGVEVDLVLERGADEVAAVEVKAAATVTEADFRGLRKLQAAAGTRFRCGVVLYDGEHALRFGPGLHAVPIRALWDTKKTMDQP